MHCWNCGHIVNGDEKKCPSCGASRKIEKGTKIHYCPNCGKGIWGKEKCKYCGFDVILKKVVQEVEAVDEKKTASTVRACASMKASDDWNVDKQGPPQNVKNKTSDESKKEAILKKLQQQDSAVQNQVLKRLEDAKTQEISEKTADFFLSLPGLENINPKIQQEARFVLSTRYPDFLKNECWKICVDIMQIVYFPCISNFTDVQTWDTYCKFRDLYGVLQDHVLEKRMFEMMSQEMKRVSSNEEQIQLFCQCFFDVKSSSSLLLIQNHPEVFGIFLQVLNFLQLEFQKYSKEQWQKYYDYVLENMLHNANWDMMEQIFDGMSEEPLFERMQKIYNLVTVISKKSPSFINGIASTKMLYDDYLFQSELYTKNPTNSRWESDVKSLVFQNSCGVPVLSNLQKVAADEIEKEPGLSQVFPVAYCELWKALFATPLNHHSVDEIVHQVKMAESFLTDYPRKEEGMAEIYRVAFELLPLEQLQSANEESIAYLYTHCRNTGFLYSKVSAYYEMDQFLVSYDDFKKISDVWYKLNPKLDYYERLERRRWILCSKRNPSELEKQTLVFFVLHQIKSSNYMFFKFWDLLVADQNAMVSNEDKPIYLCYSILFCKCLYDIKLQNTCARFFTNEMCRCIEDGDVRQHLKNAEFKKLYQDIKNTYFWNKDDEKKEIYQAAKNTGDANLMEIFLGESAGNAVRKEQSKAHHKLIFLIIISIIILIISIFGRIVQMNLLMKIIMTGLLIIYIIVSLCILVPSMLEKYKKK